MRKYFYNIVKYFFRRILSPSPEESHGGVDLSEVFPGGLGPDHRHPHHLLRVGVQLGVFLLRKRHLPVREGDIPPWSLEAEGGQATLRSDHENIFYKGTIITRSMSEIMLRRVGLQTVTALLSRAQSQKRVEEQSEERNQFRPDSTQLYIRGWLKSRVLNKS